MSIARADARQRMPGRSSWLCRGDFDRERLLDMEERVKPARRRTFAVLALSIAAVSPWLGWWPLLFMLPSALAFSAADRVLTRVERPEYVMFSAWIAGQLAIAGAVWLEGGPPQGPIYWLAIPVVTLSSRFSMRGVAAGVAVACALVLAVGFGAGTAAVLADPVYVVGPLALVLCVAALSVPLMNSDIQHRSDAVIDQLTGMLNRKALTARAQELTQQAEITGEPVGVIVADLDHFKQVNDTHGHGVGDVVLKEVAYVLRKQLRAFDLAYRLGGEEFLILVPGSDAEQTAELAERLRGAACALPVSSGVTVTMSVGVAASSRGAGFDYGSIFAAADAALYEAKRSGRNRVCVDRAVALLAA